MFLLDNDVISNLRKKREPNPAVVWFRSLAPDGFALAGVTVYEQLIGIEYLKHNVIDRAEELSAWWEGFLATLKPGQVIYPDEAIMRIYAKIFVEPKLRNFLNAPRAAARPRMAGDLVLAATAIAKGLPIATFNVGDFQAISLLFPLPGAFHPGRGEWFVASSTGLP
jgi:predicted nucleic acid-binding protein